MIQQRQYNFKDVNDLAAKSSALIEAWLDERERTISVTNVENDKTYRKQDVDLVIVRRSPEGDIREQKIEIKADRLAHRTGNLFFETISNVSTGSPGCFLYSEADLLFYHLVEVGKVYVFEFARIRKWFLVNQTQFGEPARTRTPLVNGESYQTEGYKVPICRILREAPPLLIIEDLPLILPDEPRKTQTVTRKM